MRILIKVITLLIFLYPAYAFSKIYYKISPVFEADKPYLEIKVIYRANQEGKTKFFLPTEWADAKEFEKGIYDFKLKTPGYIHRINNNQLLIATQPNIDLELSYKIENQSDHPFKPKISNEFFHFFGRSVFIVPDISFKQKQQIILEWNDSNTFNSFGMKKQKQELKLNINDLNDGLFVGGKVKEYNYKDAHNSITTVIYSKDDQKAKDIAELSIKILLAQFKTMEDSANDYLISIIEPNDNYLSMGANVSNAFTMIMDSTNHYSLDTLLYYLAHEHFHAWIGRKLYSTDDYIEQMWFMEGFNDFCSTLNAYENELIVLNRYLDLYNQILKGYFTHPFKGIPNSKMANDYWNIDQLQKLPYLKGHIFAQEVNNILKNENPSESVIVFIKNILQNYATNSPIKLDNKKILFFLNQYTNQPISQLWIEYFEKGKDIKLSPTLFDKKVELHWVKEELDDYGFNLEKSYEYNVVIGVMPFSHAERAGLRNGQILEGIKFKDKSLTLKVKTGFNDFKEIIINPCTKETLVPQYKLRE